VTDAALIVGTLIVGVVIGVLVMWLVHRRLLVAEVARARLESNVIAQAEVGRLREAVARQETEAELTARHGNVADLLAPIRETLARYDEQLARIGRAQAESSGAIGERLEAVAIAGESLRQETQRLAQALRAPSVRGQWGELQLRRVCELAGMIAYCDFDPQVTVRNEDGVQRPDLVVRLPGNRQLVVDAKAPLAAYLEASAATDERVRAAHLAAHAAQLRLHVQRLAAKKYWAQFADTPEFVVLFLPGEVFFSAALEADPALLELALGERVLLATPTTLIALLKAAAYGWRQERVTADAAQVIALGQELQQRLAVFDEQIGQIGKGLQRAVVAYNRAVGSLEHRVLVSARKLADLQTGGPTLEAPAMIDLTVRLADPAEPEAIA
jgi:DNA recombination protein RmuC